MKEEIKKISRFLSPDYMGGVASSEEEKDGRDAREAALKIALHVLKGMKEPDLVEKLVKSKICVVTVLFSYDVSTDPWVLEPL